MDFDKNLKVNHDHYVMIELVGKMMMMEVVEKAI
jgi:hypothetical protein